MGITIIDIIIIIIIIIIAIIVSSMPVLTYQLVQELSQRAIIPFFFSLADMTITDVL